VQCVLYYVLLGGGSMDSRLGRALGRGAAGRVAGDVNPEAEAEAEADGAGGRAEDEDELEESEEAEGSGG
jgi:hypothetical protein